MEKKGKKLIVFGVILLGLIGLGLMINSLFFKPYICKGLGCGEPWPRPTIIEIIEGSQKKVTFVNMGFNLENGDEMEFPIGIRNTDQNLNYVFYVQFDCLVTYSNYTGCPTLVVDDRTNEWNWFSTLENIPLTSNESKAVFVKVNAQGSADVYRGKIIVWKCEGEVGNPCPEQLCYDRNGNIPSQEYIHDSCQDFDSSLVSISEHGTQQIHIILSEER